MSHGSLVEMAEQMLSERWGRLIEDPTFKAPAEWNPNDNPRKLAAEYLQLYPWVQQLERELTTSNELLEEISDRIHGLSDTVSAQTSKNRSALGQNVAA